MHLPPYTYDKATIDEKVAGGGTFDPTQYYNKTQTNELLENKLDASAYTPCDLSNYYTKPEVDEKVDNLYLRCNRDEYESLSQEERDSYLIAVVEEMAELDATDLSNLTSALGDETAGETMIMDISENEAIAITDEIIGGTK